MQLLLCVSHSKQSNLHQVGKICDLVLGVLGGKKLDFGVKNLKSHIWIFLTNPMGYSAHLFRVSSPHYWPKNRPSDFKLRSLLKRY